MTEEAKREKETKRETSRRKSRRIRKLRNLANANNITNNMSSHVAAASGKPSLKELAQLDSLGPFAAGSQNWLRPGELSLPPEVEGKQRGELLFTLGPLSWSSSDEAQGKGSKGTVVCFRFWGQEELEEGNYVVLDSVSSLSIPIRCSPINFTRYLKDSQPLQLSVQLEGQEPGVAVSADIDVVELDVKKPLKGTFNLIESKAFTTVGQIEMHLQINYSLISSFELNEHIANTDMTLPLFPVSDFDIDLNDERLGKLASEHANNRYKDAGGGENNSEIEAEEEGNLQMDKNYFGWGPSEQFKKAAAQRDRLSTSTFLDATGRGASIHTITEPTWDSVLARAQRLSNAMQKAIAGRAELEAAAGAGVLQLDPDASHPEKQNQGLATEEAEEFSPCPSLTSSMEDVPGTVLVSSVPTSKTIELEGSGLPHSKVNGDARAATSDVEDRAAGVGKEKVQEVVDFTIESPTTEKRNESKIQMTLRVKDIHLVSKDLKPSRIIIAVKCALSDIEEASRFTFTAHSIKQQGRLLFQIKEKDLREMPQDKLLLSIELWQIQDKRHTVLVDANSCKLIGLSTFSAKDIIDNSEQSIDSLAKRCLGKPVSFSLSKSIIDLLRDSCTGSISVKFEFKSLQGIRDEPEVIRVPGKLLSPATQGANRMEELESKPMIEEKAEGSGSGLTDHVFEVTVEKATGLKLIPSLKYFLSYTFQSSEDAEPLCTKEMAPSSIMQINARACHTITLPQAETVLMNIGSFHGQNLGFDLRSISDDTNTGASWHATGSLDFMELVEMTCSGTLPFEKSFSVPLKLNEDIYSASLRQKSSPLLSVRIKYAAEKNEEEPERKEASSQKEKDESDLHLPERKVIAADDALVLAKYEEDDIETLADEERNLDIEEYQITGSNSMKAKVDFSIGKVCGLRTMISSATHDYKDSNTLKGALKFGPNTFITTKFAPRESYFQEFLPETSTDFKAENWIPDFEYFKSYNMYLSPSSVNLMTKESIEIEVWHYTPSRQMSGGAGAGKKILLGICKIPWANVLTCPRGIYGLHTVLCPKLQTPIGAIEINVTLQMRSYMLQNSSILESCEPVREMLPDEFLEHNKKSIELYTGKYANFVVAVDNVTVSASDTLHFNHKLRYCIAMSVNGFMGETSSKAMHPKPSTHRRMWEKLNLSHRAFKSFKVDKFFVAAINNSPLTVKLIECDANRNDVEIAFGDIDLSQLLLERNSVSETSRMISGTYTLVPCKRDYIEIRVRVKVLLKGTSYNEFSLHPAAAEGDVEVDPEPQHEEEGEEDVPQDEHIFNSMDQDLEHAKLVTVLDLDNSEEEIREDFAGENDNISAAESEISDVAEVLTLLESQEAQPESNDVLVCIEDALHISGKLAAAAASSPTYAYVTFMWPEHQEAVCSSLAACVPESQNSSKHKCKWYFTKHLSFKDFDGEDANEQHSIILQVWSRSKRVSESIEFSELDMPVVPDSGTDSLVGSAVVDMTALSSGLDEIHGWYNISDFNQHCCGQLKVRISLLNGKKHSSKPVLQDDHAFPTIDFGRHSLVSEEEQGLVLDQSNLTALTTMDGEGVLFMPQEEAPAPPSPRVAEELEASSVNFLAFTRSICADLGNLEERILSLSPSKTLDAESEQGLPAGGSQVEATHGEEEIFLNQIDLTIKPDQEAAVGISCSDGDERTTTSGLEEEEEEEGGGGREDGDVTATGVSLGGGDLADIPPARLVERPGLNYDRIARILSAG